MMTLPAQTFLASVLLATLTPVFAADVAKPRPPNIVYIMADELGYFEPGFMGGKNIQTPHLDRMATEGMRFNHLFAGSSVCAPTRACFLTGKHSGHTSVRSNGGGTPLRAEEITIASMLKPLGYATGGFGKWGVGGRDSTGVPEKHGFDVFLGYYDQVHAHTYYPPYLIRNSEEVPLAGNRGGSRGQTYSHYVIHDAAVKFIRDHAKAPFFAYLPYTPPHGNFDIPDTDAAWALYQDKPWPEPARRYAAMVTMMDRQIGEIFALLKELRLDDNTLVFFSGDNGGADYFKSPEFPRGIHLANKHPQTGIEYRGTKGTLYEGGLRIPFLARWPGKIAPGSVSDFLGYFPDLMPTIAAVTGATAPAGIDGVSLLPTLIGEKAAGQKQAQHDYLYWEINNWTALREGNWRIVRPKADAPWELYDLARDPSEAQSVAAAHPAVLARLTALAASAREPVREGTFSNTARHERDRRAKFGKQDEAEASELQPKGKAKGKANKQAQNK
ncbi:MAG: sulfatase-like hydrolase/transferase [Opitutaceae bacterium]|nr:sulfatase-like hydrolase/transferase [Opitutaceae bacterium]